MPPQRKLFNQVTKLLEDDGKGVLKLGWRQACLLVQRVGDIVVGVVVFGGLQRKLLINDGSKKASFL